MITSAWGIEGCGKSSLGLSFPKPLFHLDLDLGGFERAAWWVEEKAKETGTALRIKKCEPKEDISKLDWNAWDIVSKPYLAPIQLEKLLGVPNAGKDVTVRFPREVKGIKELWQEIIIDVVTVCRVSAVKTIMPDSATQLWWLCHTGFLQEKQEIQIGQGMKTNDSKFREKLMPVEFPNNRMRDLIYCLAPDTKILKADLSWASLKDIIVGDELVGVEEQQTRFRKMVPTIVEDKWNVIDEAYAIVFANNKVIVANGKHPFLRANGDRGNQRGSKDRAKRIVDWARTDELEVGDILKYICSPWEYDTSREAGYLAGSFNSEGSICATSVNFAQVPGTFMDKIETILTDKEYQYGSYEWKDKRPERTNLVGRLSLNGIPNMLRFLGSVRPERLLEKAPMIWEGHSIQGSAEITSIVKFGRTELVHLQTSTHTFIAEGLPTHNTVRSFGKNLVMTHYPKDIYAEKVGDKGIESYKTGEVEPDGFKHTVTLDDIVLWCFAETDKRREIVAGVANPDYNKPVPRAKISLKCGLSGMGMKAVGLELPTPDYEGLMELQTMLRGE